MRSSLFSGLSGSILVLSAAACSKDPPPPAPTQETQTATANSVAPTSPAPAPAPTAAITASAASSANAEPPAPSGPTACPSPDDWSNLSGFASDCGYKWTTKSADLPKGPEWQPCDVTNGDPSSSCKKFARTGKVDNFALGTNSAGKTQIGFVEQCPAPQIVIADVDGPTRFALQSGTGGLEPSACNMKLLAVDFGRSVAVLGGSKESNDPEYGKCVGNAYVGGNVGSAPSIMMFQSQDTFDVRGSSGSVTTEGWFADGKSKRWNGKKFEVLESFDGYQMTEKLWASDRRGLFVKGESEPKPILTVPEGRSWSVFRRRNKRMAWIESNKDKSSCWLVAGDLDKSEMLEKAQRIAKITCTTRFFEIGCDAAIFSGDEGVRWVSLTDGSSRKSDIKANVQALDCKEAYFIHSEHVLRFELSALGELQKAVDPIEDLPITLPPVDADAGAPDAATSDAAAAPATSASK